MAGCGIGSYRGWMRSALAWLKLAFKVVLIPAIAVAVCRHFWILLQASPPNLDDFVFRWEYLLASAMCYLAAHTLWGTFFWQLLRDQGTGLTWFAAIRAYFVSQVGKYLPGKAWVILLRMMMLRDKNVSASVVGVCGIYETLTSMAAGAMIAAMLLPYTGLVPKERIEGGGLERWGVLGVAMLPIGAWLLNRLVVRIARRRLGPDAKPFPKPSLLRLLQGLVQAAVGWVLLGLGLMLTLKGIHAEPLSIDGERAVGLLGANSVAYIAGFVLLFLPGGLGAREELLQRMMTEQLKPELGDAALPLAIAAALLLRLLWTLAEVVVGLILWFAGRRTTATAVETTEVVHAG